jgi:hypothetical protein
VAERDWAAWHEPYDQPGSYLSRRLTTVQQRIREALSAQPPGPIRVISMCAGQGRDLLGVLPEHPRRDDVVARLVELDPYLAAYAAESARSAGLDNVDIVVADAGLSGAYDGLVPAHVALVCGVFGNIPENDIRGTMSALPRLCLPGATVIWTRHRRAPDRTGAIREWFAESGFEELAFDTEEDFPFGVGTHRLVGEVLPYQRDLRLFEFIDHR